MKTQILLTAISLILLSTTVWAEDQSPAPEAVASTAAISVSPDQRVTNKINARIVESANTFLDYLIQDVCVDNKDYVTPGDPAKCAKHRNVRIGEKVPYFTTDTDHNNNEAHYEARFSYPVLGSDGALKLLYSKLSYASEGAAMTFRFDPTKDGFELLDVSGDYVSMIRYSDPGCLDQKFDSGDVRQNGWIVMSPDGNGGDKTGLLNITRLSSPVPDACRTENTTAAGYNPVSKYPQSRTLWYGPKTVTFESGAVLQAVQSLHFFDGNAASPNDSFVRTTYTREYGLSKWEAWWPLALCKSQRGADSPDCDPKNAKNALQGRCDPNAGNETWEGQPWVRMDCRDLTNYTALSTAVLPYDVAMASGNDMSDLNQAGTLAAAARTDALLNTYKTWKNAGTLTANPFPNPQPTGVANSSSVSAPSGSNSQTTTTAQ